MYCVCMDHSLRRRANINPTLVQCHVFTGMRLRALVTNRLPGSAHTLFIIMKLLPYYGFVPPFVVFEAHNTPVGMQIQNWRKHKKN